ncbi:hypothetical protein EDD21DRAFT_357773 [Dissophora ornata]|nr:hypothetical protein EDD21DRAFT_357773 [Dissophora ornata]
MDKLDVFSKIYWKFQSDLSPQEAQESAKLYLNIARKTHNSELIKTNCCNALGALYRIPRAERKTLMSSLNEDDKTTCTDVAAIFFDASQLLENSGHSHESKISRLNEKKWGNAQLGLVLSFGCAVSDKENMKLHTRKSQARKKCTLRTDLHVVNTRRHWGATNFRSVRQEEQ